MQYLDSTFVSSSVVATMPNDCNFHIVPTARPQMPRPSFTASWLSSPSCCTCMLIHNERSWHTASTKTRWKAFWHQEGYPEIKSIENYWCLCVYYYTEYYCTETTQQGQSLRKAPQATQLFSMLGLLPPRLLHLFSSVMISYETASLSSTEIVEQPMRSFGTIRFD